jgi:hypothetical protein
VSITIVIHQRRLDYRKLIRSCDVTSPEKARHLFRLNELYNSDQAWFGRDHFGAGNKFITPMIANGKVYVGTTDGIGVFGLLGKK